MRRMGQQEYQRSAAEAKEEEQRRKERYNMYYEGLHSKQHEQAQRFQAYLQQESVQRIEAKETWKRKHGEESPVLKGNKSMIAPWEGSAWDAERWRQE